MSAALALAVFACGPPANEPSPDPPPVRCTANGTAFSWALGDRPLAVWTPALVPPKGNYTPLPKPALFPLYNSRGLNVLGYAPDDHPHHKGVWVAVDEVELHVGGKTLGPFKHWVEAGRIETKTIDLGDSADSQRVPAGADPGARFSVRHANDWLAPDGTPVLREDTHITVRSDGIVEYAITLLPPLGVEGTVTIGDTKEGFLGLRVADRLNAKRGTGVITNSAGGTGEKECWGKVAEWCDYSAPDLGGVAIFVHPENFRPSRFHVRAYGLMAASPFGPAAYTKGAASADPVEIDGPLTLRYAVYPHGPEADVAAAFRAYAGGR